MNLLQILTDGRHEGFTLIELIVVVAILGVLAVVLIVVINPIKFISGAQIAKSQTFAKGVKDGLTYEVLSWNFDEGSGTSAIDSSGRGETGTIVGATYVPNPDLGGGYALSFDGASNYVSYGYHAGSAVQSVGQPDITIMAWIYPKLLSGTQGIVVKNGPFYLALDGTNKRIYFALYNGAYTYTYSAVNSITDNNWQQITATYNGSETKIFINGQQSGATGITFTGNLSIVNNTMGVGYDACCGRRYFFNGLIDDVHIYAEAPTSLFTFRDWLAQLTKHPLEDNGKS
jgi:prepilin-type N-terminal cleavage/methylation domain-containing protein